METDWCLALSLFNICSLLVSITGIFSLKIILGGIVLIILLALSGLISASEVAFFSLSHVNIKELKQSSSERKKKILLLLNTHRKLLATLLIANNFVNIGMVILFTFLSESVIVDHSLNPFVRFVVEVLFITLLILLFGEIIPKIYATRHPLRIASLMSLPLFRLNKILNLTGFPNLLIKTSSAIDNKLKKKEAKLSIEQLSDALDLTSKEDVKPDERKLLKEIVKFSNIEVKQIMKSRIDAVAIDYTSTYPEVLRIIEDSGFSRIPVYHNSFDEIKGILYIKDLLPYLEEGENFYWQKLLRDAFFVPEPKKINELLKEFQSKKIHIAIVVDEYGGTSGIVTLEDVIEEIVGEINDEFDEQEIVYSKLDEKNYIFEGKSSLTDFYKITGADENIFSEVSGDADSLAGLILEIKGEIPNKNEVFKYNGFTFKIESADKRRIKRIKVTLTD